jgi:hypothetical protein
VLEGAARSRFALFGVPSARLSAEWLALPSDRDRMLDASRLPCQAVGRSDRNGWSAAVADDVADVWLAEACSTLPDNFADLRCLCQLTRAFRFLVAS